MQFVLDGPELTRLREFAQAHAAELPVLNFQLQETRSPEALQWIAAAKEQYANDDCEIDDDARLLETGNGVWVQAWVWLAYDEEEGAAAEAEES